jgi:hypothetical protein
MGTPIDQAHTTRGWPGQKRLGGRARSLVIVAAVVAATGAIALLAVGCGTGSHGAGAQVDTSTAGAAPASSPADNPSSGSGGGNLVKFAQCMRSHGVPGFPDPDASGHMRVGFGPGTGIDPNSPQFKSAMEACRTLGGSFFGRTQQANPQLQATLLKFSRCMRKNGVPNFPEPSASGALMIRTGPGGVDPNSPQFKRAMQICESLVANLAPSGTP